MAAGGEALVTAAEAFEAAAVKVDRNQGPVLLWEWWWRGRLTVADLREVLLVVRR